MLSVVLRAALLVLPVAAGAVEPGAARVEVRKSEVWLLSDGEPRQLTQDGKAKWKAALSPSGDRIAYDESCPQPEGCTPSVVILDLSGHRLTSFHAMAGAIGEDEPCNSILSVAWAGEARIAVTCHVNPSLSEYLEIELSSGRTIRDLLGTEFIRSPDGRSVAHHGWIVHFSPPYAKSDYLQVESTTIYPLPKGVRPMEQKGLDEPPEVVHWHGEKAVGIHAFMSPPCWSPDSRRVALIDCTYDWTPRTPGALDSDGTESNSRCAVVAVERTGKFRTFPLGELAAEVLAKSQLTWTDADRLTLEGPGTRLEFQIPK